MLYNLFLVLVAISGPVGLVAYIMIQGKTEQAQISLASEDHYSRLKSPASSTLSYQNQSTSRSVQPVPNLNHSHAKTRSIEWACEVLELSVEELTPETIEKAYNQKMEAYQASDQQNIPESIQQLLEQKIQDVNKARNILINSLNNKVNYYKICD